MSDLQQQIEAARKADETKPESGPPQLEENSWVLVETVGGDAQGAPGLLSGDDGTFFKLIGSLNIKGGDDSVDPRLEGRFGPRLGEFVHAYSPDGPTTDTAPRMKGLFHAFLAPGVEGTDERDMEAWKVAGEAAEAEGLNPGDYSSFAQFMAHSLACALQDKPRQLLVRTRTDKNGYLAVGAFDDATEENMKKRGVKAFGDGVPF